jgi:hypothetical protein
LGLSNDITLLLLLLFLGTISIFIYYILNKSIYSIILSEENETFSFPISILFITSVIGTIFTKGQTIYLPIFFILTYFIFVKFKLTIIYNLNFINSDLIIFIFYFILIFGIQWYFLHNPLGGFFNNYPDAYIYMNQISLLDKWSIEAPAVELEKLEFGFQSFQKPYHYLEFWPAVLIHRISYFNSFQIYNFWMIPFFGSILIYQAYIYLKNRFSNIFLLITLPLAVYFTLRYNYFDELIKKIFISFDLNTSYFKSVFFQNFSSPHFFSFELGIKLIVSGIFLFPLFLLLIEKKEQLFAINLGILPIVNFSLAPFSLLLSSTLFIRSFIFKNIKTIYLIPFVNIIFLALFYYLLKNKNIPEISPDFYNLILSGVNNFRTDFKLILFNNFNMIFQNFYYLILLCFLLSTKIKNKYFIILLILSFYPIIFIDYKNLIFIYLILLLSVCIFLFFKEKNKINILTNLFTTGVFSVFLLTNIMIFFQGMVESFQLSAIVYFPLFFILTLFFIKENMSENNWIIKTLFLSFIWIPLNIFGICQENIKCQNRKKGVEEFNYKFKKFGGYPKDFRSVYFSEFSMIPYLYYDRMGYNFQHGTDNFFTTCLSLDAISKKDSISLKTSGAFGLLQNFPFSIWQESQKNSGLSMDIKKKKFILDKKINLVLRHNDYNRQKIQFLNELLTDSLYNSQYNYWIYKLR